MPVKFRCRHCGYVLYEFKGVGQNYVGVPTPLEVIKLVGYVCPNCKRVLEVPRSNFKEFIVVKPTPTQVVGVVDERLKALTPTPLRTESAISH